MKIKHFTLAILAMTALSVSGGNKKISFKPSDASKWVYVIKDKISSPAALFLFENDVLKISDISAGYLRTPVKYKNFTLETDWRWTKVKANSGVLVHIQPTDTVWPTCYQVQQKADAAGDIICMNGLKANECTDKVKFAIPKMKPSNEKPLGEWNHLKIISKNGTLTVYVNGELQNKITGLSVKDGYIGFQAEGKPMEFKNLIIK
jgi:hypothetical protein